MKNPWLALGASLFLPGTGHLYLGERAKGWTFLCMDAGIFVSFWISHSLIACVLLSVVYLGIVIPAALDAFQNASGKPHVLTGDSVPYVLLMLLTVGPFAVPLLWQSRKFSKNAKIGWTVFVILIALLMIAMVNVLASFLNLLTQGNPSGTSLKF
jgi:hypothetical protein